MLFERAGSSPANGTCQYSTMAVQPPCKRQVFGSSPNTGFWKTENKIHSRISVSLKYLELLKKNIFARRVVNAVAEYNAVQRHLRVAPGTTLIKATSCVLIYRTMRPYTRHKDGNPKEGKHQSLCQLSTRDGSMQGESPCQHSFDAGYINGR